MLSRSEPLTHREAVRTHSHTHTDTGNTAAKGLFCTEEDSMGLKIQNSTLPQVKILISKKLHILRPAIEYMQQISNPKKVRLSIDVVCRFILVSIKKVY